MEFARMLRRESSGAGGVPNHDEEGHRLFQVRTVRETLEAAKLGNSGETGPLIDGASAARPA
jgi:hypothetical protein